LEGKRKGCSVLELVLFTEKGRKGKFWDALHDQLGKSVTNFNLPFGGGRVRKRAGARAFCRGNRKKKRVKKHKIPRQKFVKGGASRTCVKRSNQKKQRKKEIQSH